MLFFNLLNIVNTPTSFLPCIIKIDIEICIFVENKPSYIRKLEIHSPTKIGILRNIFEIGILFL